MSDTNRWKAIIYVLIGASSYGVLSSFVKLAYSNGFSAAEVTGSQVLFGCISMWLLSMPLWSRLREVTFSQMAKLIGSGTFTGLTGIFYYQSLQVLDASFAVLLLFQFTWMGLVLDFVRYGRTPRRTQLVGAVIVLAGTWLAAGLGGGIPIGRLSLSGIGLGLLAAVSYTLFVHFSGSVAVTVPASLRSAWMLTGAAILTMLFYPPQFLWNGALFEGLWVWTILLGVFGMIVPPYLFAKGAPSLTTGLAAILGSVELPVVLICSTLLLQEHSAKLQWLGVALILAGIVISELLGHVRSGDDFQQQKLASANVLDVLSDSREEN